MWFDASASGQFKMTLLLKSGQKIETSDIPEDRLNFVLGQLQAASLWFAQ